MVSIGILGGGLTGLTIANSLTCAFGVLEKESECGGLCRTLQQDGFTFDYGGAHIIFSRNIEPVNFMLEVLGKNYVRRRRNNKILFKGRLVKYPFENGLSDLSKEDCFECLYYYLKNDYAKPSNFKEWLYYTFGKGVAACFESLWPFGIIPQRNTGLFHDTGFLLNSNIHNRRIRGQTLAEPCTTWHIFSNLL